MGSIGAILGNNGKENGNYCSMLGLYMGGCQNYGPFLGPYYNTAPNIYGTQKGTIILTTTHINCSLNSLKGGLYGRLYRGLLYSLLRGILGV